MVDKKDNYKFDMGLKELRTSLFWSFFGREGTINSNWNTTPHNLKNTYRTFLGSNRNKRTLSLSPKSSCSYIYIKKFIENWLTSNCQWVEGAITEAGMENQVSFIMTRFPHPPPLNTHTQTRPGTRHADMQIMNSPNAALREIDILRVSFSQEISKKKFFHSGWHLITRSLIIKRLI